MVIMPRKKISVLGALSTDTIHLTNQPLALGSVVRSQQYTEPVGGRAVNIAVAASRSSRQVPQTESHLLPIDSEDEDENAPEVRVVAAVTKDNMEESKRWLKQNGVIADGLRIVEGEKTDQDQTLSIFDARAARTQEIVTQGVSQNWTAAHFRTIKEVGGGVVPDLVIVTTELPRLVVSQIIDTAAAAKVEVLVYAFSPTPLNARHYQKTSHIICNHSSATMMLGYGDQDEVTDDMWPDLCNNFHTQKGVKNVVLNTGRRGAFYKNEEDNGFVSGYMINRQVADSSGSIAAFVGTYAAELLRHRQSGTWDIRTTSERANKACALASAQVGYRDSIPWANHITGFTEAPLYASIEDFLSEPPTRVVPW